MTPFQKDVVDRLARIETLLEANKGLEARVRALESFRWLIVGMAAAVSAITSLVTTGQLHMPRL